MNNTLFGKKVLVTGGSRGIGAGIVRHLAECGAQVAFTYSSREDAAQEVLTSLPGNGHLFVQMNVASETSVAEAFNKVLESFTGLDGLVNNAGIAKDQLLLRMKAEDFNAVIDTNLKGTFFCTKAALKPMLRKGGSIVNITSVIGEIGNPGQSNYAASKAGIVAFTKSVAKEVASRGIRLNCIAPGYIATDMTETLTEEQKNKLLQQIPAQSIGSPADVAAAVAFLLSDGAKYITGHTLDVNGGIYMN